MVTPFYPLPKYSMKDLFYNSQWGTLGWSNHFGNNRALTTLPHRGLSGLNANPGKALTVFSNTNPNTYQSTIKRTSWLNKGKIRWECYFAFNSDSNNVNQISFGVDTQIGIYPSEIRRFFRIGWFGTDKTWKYTAGFEGNWQNIFSQNLLENHWYYLRFDFNLGTGKYEIFQCNTTSKNINSIVAMLPHNCGLCSSPCNPPGTSITCEAPYLNNLMNFQYAVKTTTLNKNVYIYIDSSLISFE